MFISEECQIDLAILVDASGSIFDAAGGQQNWLDQLEFVSQVIDSVGDDGSTRTALITFSNGYTHSQTHYDTNIEHAIDCCIFFYLCFNNNLIGQKLSNQKTK